MMPVEAMPVKSLIAAPTEGATVGEEPVTIQGVAWAGDVTVEKVEVSVDDGKTWDLARLVGNEQRYAWRQWQYLYRDAESSRSGRDLVPRD
ncbi:MAG: Ig-like domain-containing protein [Nitrospiraceae bacterium]